MISAGRVSTAWHLCEDIHCTTVAVVSFDVMDLTGGIAVIMGFCTAIDMQSVVGQ